MKQLKNRTIFVLLFTVMLIGGMVFLLFSYVVDGSYWAAHRAGASISSGTITDRTGTVLYDFESGRYNDDWSTRVSTVHAVGDKTGSIAYGAKSQFAGGMSGFNIITGITQNTREIRLSLDAHLNNTALYAMGDRKGVVGLYNYKTGEILCMLSTPAFDPEDSDTIRRINEGDEEFEGAYLNRFLSSTYTPGSTFKVVTTAAALENLKKVDDFYFECDSDLSYGDDSVTCPYAHGGVDLKEALAKSCNGAFATLGNELGGKKLKSYAEKAHLLERMEVSGLKTAAGSFSTTSSKIDEGWSGVGQYRNLVNPCTEMALMGCIASGGEAAAPFLLMPEESGFFGTSKPETISIGWKSETCAQLREMMRYNVTSHYKQLDFGDLPVCAKSGTAEVGGDSKPHAWFTGFVDSEEYPYAFVAVVEHGGTGATVAGAIIEELLWQIQ